MNPMDLKRGMDVAIQTVVDSLKKQSKDISSKEEIEQVYFIFLLINLGCYYFSKWR